MKMNSPLRSVEMARFEGSKRLCFEEKQARFCCVEPSVSQLNCYSWCGFPFRCLENDSADHIHILKYFLRTCNQTAGTDSFCSAQPPHNRSRIDSSQREKHQGLRMQAESCQVIWGEIRGKSQSTWGTTAQAPGDQSCDLP